MIFNCTLTVKPIILPKLIKKILKYWKCYVHLNVILGEHATNALNHLYTASSYTKRVVLSR